MVIEADDFCLFDVSFVVVGSAYRVRNGWIVERKLYQEESVVDAVIHLVKRFDVLLQLPLSYWFVWLYRSIGRWADKSHVAIGARVLTFV